VKIEIREARESDLPLVLPLYGELGLDNGEVLSLAEAQRLFRGMGSYPDYRLYLVVHEGAIIGVFALLIMENLGHLGKPSAVLEDMVVTGEWQRKGVGRQMIAFALASSREKGCYKLSLSSNKERREAHRFYEDLGFKRHGYSFALFLEDEEVLGAKATEVFYSEEGEVFGA
jgi:GNAT superfamily N-acetyltransferase